MVGAFSVATRRIQANDTKGHEASVQGNFHMVIAGGELDASRGPGCRQTRFLHE